MKNAGRGLATSIPAVTQMQPALDRDYSPRLALKQERETILSIRGLIYADNQVRANPDLSLAAKVTLYTLGGIHNQEAAKCNPSVAFIAQRAGISERSVQSATAELQRKRIIRIIERKAKEGGKKKNLTNIYVLKMGAKSAGRGGANPAPNKDIYQPSAFEDLAMLIDDGLGDE